MATANLTAIKDRIAQLNVIPEPKDRTTAPRSRRHRQRRKESQKSATARTATTLAATASRSGARVLALLSALGLAGVSGFFSIAGLTSIFLGSFWPVVAMGTVFEGAKLSAVALLGQGHVASRPLKFAVVSLIAALMVLNIIGAYGFLARAQITHRVSGEIQVAGHAAQVEARKRLATADVADIDKRIGQIDTAIADATKRGRIASAMNVAERQTARRNGLIADRARAASALASIEIEGAGVDGERAERTAEFGPVEYLSKLLGIEREIVMRWFIVLVACLLDPAALMLLLAATMRE